MTTTFRRGLAVAAGLSTALPFAEGLLKSGWIEVVLLVPVFWFLLPGRGSPRLAGCLLAITAACVTGTALDLALRPVMDRRLSYTPMNISSHKLPRLPMVGRWDANLDLEDELYGDMAAMLGEPGLREPRRIRFRTDEAGFRNDAVPDRIDLLVLGDSFAAGASTTQERMFSSLLAGKLGGRVYNLGYPGGPYDQFINLAVEGPRLPLAPDARVVWTFFVGNDLDDAGGEVWDLDALPWKSPVGQALVRYRTFRNRSPLNRLMENLRARWTQSRRQVPDVLVRTLPDGRAMLFHAKHEGWGRRARTEVEAHPNFPKLERTLAAMGRLTKARGLSVTVLILPTKGEVYRWVLDGKPAPAWDAAPSGFVQAVLAACDRASLRCLDAKPFLVEEARRLYESAGRLLWWRDDTHLGELGHDAVARLIEAEVLGRAPADVVRTARPEGR